MASKAAALMAGEVIQMAPFPKLIVKLDSEVTPAQAQKAVRDCCVALERHTKTASYLRIVAGHLISQIKERELFKPDFASFEAYMRFLDERYNLSRSVVREALQIVTAFPKLEPESVQRTPIRNMILAASAAKKSEPKEAKAILYEAGKRDYAGYRSYLEDKQLLPQRGRPVGGSRKTGIVKLAVECSARIATKFRERAAAYDSPAKYLDHLLSLDTQAEAA